MHALLGLILSASLAFTLTARAGAEQSDAPGANLQDAASPSLPRQPAQDAPAAEPPPTAENLPLENELTEEARQAISRGFRYLAAQQNEDGSFGRGRYGRNVGITSLAAIAFMADGHLPGRGEYGEQISRALEFVLANSTESGLLAADTGHGPMYGHGFGALFLAEIYGMNPEDRRVRDALVRAVDLMIGTQNEEGGWRYNPVPYDADISVTITQIMALRAARNAGIRVPRATIDRAVEYVRACQNLDGGFKYMLTTGGSAWPRTAAGVASLYYAGIYDDDSITRGLDYLMRIALPGEGHPSQAHYYYGHYYAVQAMYLAGGEYWQRWWPAVRDELIARQSTSGGWLDHHAGGAYATAMSLIVLQMPKRYLPIFQK